MPASDEQVVWGLIDELQADDRRVHEGTIMGGCCARVDGEFLALVGSTGGGLVVKLPRERVTELIEQGVGEPVAPRRVDPGARPSALAAPAPRGHRVRRSERSLRSRDAGPSSGPSRR
jgi:hypothetical protein